MTVPVLTSRDIAIGLAARSARIGLGAAQAALLPARLATRVPIVGDRLRRATEELGAEGRSVRIRGRAQLEDLAAELLDAPEVGRTVDRLLAGPLTDAVARSLAEHRVVERVAAEVVATADLDRLVEAVLEHERTGVLVDRALASPGLERLLVRVLESQLVDALTDRVLQSPELERVVQYVATSPQVLDAVAQQTQTMAGEITADVRRRTQAADDVAERTVRGWLRRPQQP
jgi:hypothetical protein